MPRFRSPRRQRQLAQRMTALVAALHGALLLTLALDEDPLPWEVGLFELLWAAAHRPMFYPLVAVLIAGPVLTALAWRVPGRHRHYLLGIWGVSVLLLGTVFAERIRLMLEILHWRFFG